MARGLTRRDALSWALASVALGCRSGARAAPSAAASAQQSELAWGGLDVAQVSQMAESDRGGTAVVLLHGFGARGDDLVPLARAMQHPQTRFILPAAPVVLMGGGRAWWNIDASDRPRYVTDPGDVARSAPALDAARNAVQGVLRTALQRYAPSALMIAGFSQGAMLALDVALAASPPVNRVGVLSGAFLVDAAQRLGAQVAPPPAVFISHGRGDQVLPFTGGERMKAALEARGIAVTWRPFEGAHEIPEGIVTELDGFFFGG